MPYLITHYWPGGTDEQYRTTANVVHPSGGLPKGQRYHAAGPTEGGYLVVAVWDSKADYERFVEETLMPALKQIGGGFNGQPDARTSEIENLVTA